MKKIFTFSFFLVSVQIVLAQQAGLPEVSKRVDFAGITVNLDADARALVQKEVSALLIPENKYVLDKLQRIQWYFPVIERILEQEKVPDDFKYLAVVESALLPDAISSSNAVGFWQMKAATAQELGLRVDSDIDERKNIYASTKAAASYLKRNNQIYKNWMSSLYSYLLGAGGISKIVPSEWSGASTVEFDGRTDRYLIKTIAARIAFEYRVNRMRESTLAFIEYKKGKGKTLTQIASSFDVDAAELKKNNSWLQINTIPADYSVALLVPVTRMDMVQTKIGSQPNIVETRSGKAGRVEKMDKEYPVLVRVTKQTNNEDAPVFYEINEKKGILAKPGDDVASLAKAGKLKIKDFLLFNDMTDADVVDAGMVYYLQRKYNKGPIETHEVKLGESMWELSHIFGIQLKYFLKFNRIKGRADVAEGQVVYLQRKRPKNLPVEVKKEGRDLEVPQQQKLPIMEKYEKEVAAKQDVVAKNDTKPTNEDKPKQTTEQDNTKPLPSETIVIERPARKQPQTQTPPPQAPPQTRKEENTELEKEDKTSQIKEEKIIPIKEEKKTTPKEEKKEPAKEEKKTTPKEEKKEPAKEEKKSSTKDEKISPPVLTNAPKEEEEDDIVVISDDEDKTDDTRPATNPNVNIVNSAPNSKTAPKKQYHKVEPGQNLYSIARKYDLTVRELAALNDIPTTERVRIGQRLIVGGGAVSNSEGSSDNKSAKQEKKESTKEDKREEHSTTRHRVVKGETLFSISRHYGVSMRQIQEWNNMSERGVKIGQRLLIKKD